MNLIGQLIVAALAAQEIVEVFHHGSLFATVRASLDDRRGFVAELLRCPFCLSVWAALAAAGMVLAAAWPGWGWLWWPVLGLAAARLANLLNDYFHTACRTPGNSNEKVESIERSETEAQAGAGQNVEGSHESRVGITQTTASASEASGQNTEGSRETQGFEND